jgi:shikimate kinase
MGAGKTTVGAACATRLDRPFVDTDELVVAAAGRTVEEIFATSGEAGFRALEQQAVADACASPQPLVIACGGGVVLDPQNRNVLHGAGFVVWLRAEPSELATRVRAEARVRPLLPPAGEEQALARLATLREAAYAAVADVEVATDGRSVDEVADVVLEEVARCAA